jgi:hypothetical protein
LVATLRGSLKPKLRSKLGTPWGVKSRGHFSGLRGIREGPVYFVSANVRGYGIATWAVDADAFNSGGGVVLGVGTVARRVSDAGVDIRASTLRSWGLAPYAEGYAASRSCVK